MQLRDMHIDERVGTASRDGSWHSSRHSLVVNMENSAVGRETNMRGVEDVAILADVETESDPDPEVADQHPVQLEEEMATAGSPNRTERESHANPSLRIPRHLRPGRNEIVKRRGVAGFRGVVNTQTWLRLSDERFKDCTEFEMSHRYQTMSNEELNRWWTRVLITDQPVYVQSQAHVLGPDLHPRAGVVQLLLTLFRDATFRAVHDGEHWMVGLDPEKHAHGQLTLFSPQHPRNLKFYNAMYVEEAKMYVRVGMFVSYTIGLVTGQIGQLRFLFEMECHQFAVVLNAKEIRPNHRHGPRRNERPDERLMRQILLTDEERHNCDPLTLHMYQVSLQDETATNGYHIAAPKSP